MANVKWHYQLSFMRNCLWEDHTSSPVIPSRMVSETVCESVYALWSDMHCTFSSLVANLVLFWRLLTYQSTILHCYLPAHARCATWHPVQHDILCNIESENCGSGGQKINKPLPRPMPLVYCHESLTLCYNSNIHFLLWLHACCLWNVQTPSAVNRHHRLRWNCYTENKRNDD